MLLNFYYNWQIDKKINILISCKIEGNFHCRFLYELILKQCTYTKVNLAMLNAY